MKTVFILKKDPDTTIQTIMAETKKENEMTVIDIRGELDYDALIESIESCDRLITW